DIPSPPSPLGTSGARRPQPRVTGVLTRVRVRDRGPLRRLRRPDPRRPRLPELDDPPAARRRPDEARELARRHGPHALLRARDDEIAARREPRDRDPVRAL